ncbi:Thioredoxin peroxidase [Sphingomonas antarctica]|uniref:peroxiredoxin n=1 Tax=Sphingomonas antarctica TaxID=2040274 RepID=UPI0039E8142A
MKAALATFAALIAMPAIASLPVGAKAPDFQTMSAKAGKTAPLKLSDALKRGPVVLYFFPAAFTPGCTIEAHEFAEATDDFVKAGATVIGMAGDSIDKLAKFSVEECRNKFAVASATPDIIKGYDVTLPQLSTRSNRTSYVIGRNGRIAYVYSDKAPEAHITNTLAAVKALKR